MSRPVAQNFPEVSEQSLTDSLNQTIEGLSDQELAFLHQFVDDYEENGLGVDKASADRFAGEVKNLLKSSGEVGFDFKKSCKDFVNGLQDEQGSVEQALGKDGATSFAAKLTLQIISDQQAGDDEKLDLIKRISEEFAFLDVDQTSAQRNASFLSAVSNISKMDQIKPFMNRLAQQNSNKKKVAQNEPQAGEADSQKPSAADLAKSAQDQEESKDELQEASTSRDESKKRIIDFAKKYGPIAIAVCLAFIPSVGPVIAIAFFAAVKIYQISREESNKNSGAESYSAALPSNVGRAAQKVAVQETEVLSKEEEALKNQKKELAGSVAQAGQKAGSQAADQGLSSLKGLKLDSVRDGETPSSQISAPSASAATGQTVVAAR